MPPLNLDDTIAAIATAPGAGAIGIVRLSGKNAVEIASGMFEAQNGKKLNTVPAHTVHFGTVLNEKGHSIDQALATVFHEPKSYTGENSVEISAHGGPAVLKSILNRALSLGARHAEPGEFTKRAFLNGRMDLTQAEAVSDLIRAKTDSAVQAAMIQLEGKLSSEIRAIKDEIMSLYGQLEASLDFPDERLETDSQQKLENRFERAISRIRNLINSYSKGHMLREGVLAVLVGRPNTGKSSLLNAFLERERALVSDVPGTTRDTLEESLELGGFWLRLVDTAGLQESRDPLNLAAMERTQKLLHEGNIFLFVLDGNAGFTEEDKTVFQSLAGKEMIVVINKIDLPPAGNLTELPVSSGSIARVSAMTRAGMDELEAKILNWIQKKEKAPDSILLTRARHKAALEHALIFLERSLHALRSRESLEFVILDLKESLEKLRELIGEIYSEDLLDVIFKEFCIGK